ncbi:aromatic ring-hydroxylating dioxygenase subunit alpha [Acidisoma sp. L85]|jgi:Rieske 2Fe-2S family protein|uniref:aromatic ring-hydroxylating oxygenase subunit alpha n=1 Tax=Acidisoma sp. L85 TaxID=1641850 RepID=UPI00131D6F45|nr:aromatic ring-hydroxylating dioxygenase subunit alpha [Acidisoma sp. L85]
MSDILEAEPEVNGLTQVEPTLPSNWYFDPAQYHRELRNIWYRNWIYLCRSETLDAPLAFRTFEIGDQNVLLVRDENGALNAFHNTCRHRGAVLKTEPSGRLQARAITCPYHAWTYKLTGELARMPSKLCAPDFSKADHGLYKIALAEWSGFVFINLDENAGPFDAAPDRDDSAPVDNWPLADLRVGHSVRKLLACNWKVFWENYNECLHCAHAHPELSDIVPIYSRGLLSQRDDPNWRAQGDTTDPKLKGGLKIGAETWSMDGRALPYTFPKLTEAERAAGQTYFTKLPSMYMVAHIDYVRIVHMRPLGPEQTELTAEWLFPAETLNDPAFDLPKAVEFADLVMRQDVALCELNQKGLHSLRHRTGTLMPEEYLVHKLHNWVRSQLDES